MGILGLIHQNIRIIKSSLYTISNEHESYMQVGHYVRAYCRLVIPKLKKKKKQQQLHEEKMYQLKFKY